MRCVRKETTLQWAFGFSQRVPSLWGDRRQHKRAIRGTTLLHGKRPGKLEADMPNTSFLGLSDDCHRQDDEAIDLGWRRPTLSN